MRGPMNRKADVREFITMYRTRFTPTRDSSLACDRSFLPFYHSPTDSATREHKEEAAQILHLSDMSGPFGRERAGDRWSRETVHDGVASLVRDGSSINNNALSALASANPAAISMTTRKPVTNDSAIA